MCMNPAGRGVVQGPGSAGRPVEPTVRPVQHRGRPDPCTSSPSRRSATAWPGRIWHHRLRCRPRPPRAGLEVRWRSASGPDSRPSRRRSSTSTGSSGPTSTSGPTRPTRRSASRSGPPATAARRSRARSTRRTSRRRRGDLPLPRAPGHRRPAVPRARHPRAVRAGVRDRARGAGRATASRCVVDAARRLHADAGRSRTRSSVHNRGRATHGLADGIVITPSHNPPEDGGFKYNPPNGGPADTDVTGWIEDRGQRAPRRPDSTASRRMPFDAGARAPTRTAHDYVDAYVDDLADRHRHGRDPRRGAAASAWIRWAARASPTGRAIAERYGLDLTVVNDASIRRSAS